MKTLKDFSSKKEFFKYLIANKKELIEFKKAAQKFTEPFGVDPLQLRANKSLNTSFVDDVSSGVIKRAIIGNTYNWMDSHNDVHLDNVFSKSISERKEKISHLHDHEQKITSKVGIPIAIYEKAVDWADLGINKEGKTMALFMESNIKKELQPSIFQQYVSGDINQHSVGMYYLDIALAIDDPDSKDEFKEWTANIDKIGNKEKAIENGFFWAVKEAKLIEISCVLSGSNELTPTLPNKEEKQICESCGKDVTPDEDGECPSCGYDMKEKKESFFTKFAREVQK